MGEREEEMTDQWTPEQIKEAKEKGAPPTELRRGKVIVHSSTTSDDPTAPASTGEMLAGYRTLEEQACPKHHVKLCQYGDHEPYCPLCVDESKEEDEQERRAQDKDRADKALVAAAEKRWSAVSFGRRFRDCTWDDYKINCEGERKAKNICRQYADTFRARRDAGDCLLMLGNMGTGKNMLAALIAKDVCTMGFTVLHTSAAKIVRGIKDSWRQETSEQGYLDELRELDLLIINEVGMQKGSDFEKNYLSEIVDDRYDDRRPTIIISNNSLDDLQKYLGPRAVDRFYDGAGAVAVFNWQSRRRGRGQG